MLDRKEVLEIYKLSMTCTRSEMVNLTREQASYMSLCTLALMNVGEEMRPGITTALSRGAIKNTFLALSGRTPYILEWDTNRKAEQNAEQ